MPEDMEKKKMRYLRYSKTQKFKDCQRRYRETQKGKDMVSRYRKSDKYKKMVKVAIAINQDKYKARNAVSNAIRDGKLLRMPCMICGDERSEGHHHNGYSKDHMLDVIWLCVKHHNLAHKEKSI